MNYTQFPRRPYLNGPTPIEAMPSLSRVLGGKVNLYAKRDDLLPGAAGGGLAGEIERLGSGGHVEHQHRAHARAGGLQAVGHPRREVADGGELLGPDRGPDVAQLGEELGPIVGIGARSPLPADCRSAICLSVLLGEARTPPNSPSTCATMRSRASVSVARTRARSPWSTKNQKAAWSASGQSGSASRTSA